MKAAWSWWAECILLLLAGVLIVVAVTALPTPCPGADAAELWQWSPPAPHHQAVVAVRCANGTAGTNVGCGVYVQHGQVRGVLTVNHVFTGAKPVVVWHDGRQSVGEATRDRDDYDLGWIYVQRDDVTPLAIAPRAPAAGDWVEFATTGGPESRRRHFWGRVTSQMLGPNLQYDAAVISGDSGGAILDCNHRVVGIQSTGVGQSIAAEWPTYAGSTSPPHAAVAAFVARVSQAQTQQQCQGGQCPRPAYGGAGVGIGVGIGVGRLRMYPPAPQPSQCRPPVNPSPVVQPGLPAEPAPLPIQSPVVPPSPDLTRIESQLAGLAAQVEKLASRPAVPGPPGPVGPAGKDGANGRDGKDGAAGPAGPAAVVNYDQAAAEIVRRLPPIKVESYDRSGKLIDAEQYPYPGPIRIRYGLAQ